MMVGNQLAPVPPTYLTAINRIMDPALKIYPNGAIVACQLYLP